MDDLKKIPLLPRHPPQIFGGNHDDIDQEYFALLGVFMHFWGRFEWCLACKIFEQLDTIKSRSQRKNISYSKKMFGWHFKMTKLRKPKQQESAQLYSAYSSYKNTIKKQTTFLRSVAENVAEDCQKGYLFDALRRVSIKSRLTFVVGGDPSKQPFGSVIALRHAIAHNACSYWWNIGAYQHKAGLLRTAESKRWSKDQLDKIAQDWQAKQNASEKNDSWKFVEGVDGQYDVTAGQRWQVKLYAAKYISKSNQDITEDEIFGESAKIYEPYTKEDLRVEIGNVLEAIKKIGYDPESDALLKHLEKNFPNLLP